MWTLKEANRRRRFGGDGRRSYVVFGETESSKDVELDLTHELERIGLEKVSLEKTGVC